MRRGTPPPGELKRTKTNWRPIGALILVLLWLARQLVRHSAFDDGGSLGGGGCLVFGASTHRCVLGQDFLKIRIHPHFLSFMCGLATFCRPRRFGSSARALGRLMAWLFCFALMAGRFNPAGRCGVGHEPGPRPTAPPSRRSTTIIAQLHTLSSGQRNLPMSAEAAAVAPASWSAPVLWRFFGSEKGVSPKYRHFYFAGGAVSRNVSKSFCSCAVNCCNKPSGINEMLDAFMLVIWLRAITMRAPVTCPNTTFSGVSLNTTPLSELPSFVSTL